MATKIKTTKKVNVIDTTAELKAELKKNGVRLPHGYAIVKRKKNKVASPKKTSNKGAQALKKIVAKAKQIQKYEPNISWQQAMKLAAKKK